MPTAAEKGKGKATAATVMDSDSEGDDYFVVKPRFRPKVAPPPVRAEKSSSENEATEDDEEDEAGEARKKPKKKKRGPAKKAVVVPEWTIPGTQRNGRTNSNLRKRSSTEDRSSRDRADVFEILSSDDNSPKRPRKGKSDLSHLLEDLPPETEEEIAARKARWHRTVSAISGPSVDVVTVDDSDGATRSSPVRSSPPPANREEITIHVYMVADRNNIPEGASENAIKQFEKKRTFTTFKYGKLDRVWHGLASRLNKDADDIVLTYNKVRIFSKAQTPASLGLSDGADLKGYDIAHWNRMKDEERRELDWLRNPNARDPSPGAEAEGDVAVPSPKPEKKVKLCLRGAWGEVKLAIAHSIPFDTLAKAYCMKTKKEEKFASKISFSFDGETIGRYVTVGELDIEDGDMIDVHVPR